MNQHRHSFGDIARRSAFSFFLFSAVLLGLLLLSWYLLVPELSRVEVGGQVRGITEVREYKTDLEAQILSLESRRGTFLQPVRNPVYQRVKSLKQNRSKFQSVRSDLNRIMTTLVPEQKNAVLLTGFYFDTIRNKVELRGHIHNVGPRSMTVLAQFIDALHREEEIIDVQTSRFTRLQWTDGSFYSPFIIILTVR